MNFRNRRGAMRKKTIRIYAYEFSGEVNLSHFKLDCLPVKPRKGRYTILPCCNTKTASQIIGSLRVGWVIPARENAGGYEG